MAERPDETRRLIAKYKSDVANLEEMEEDIARRIQVMENMVPTVLVWFMWKSSQEKRRMPFPQGDTEEEAQRKLAHLETILEELQEAEFILKEEEQVLRGRIEELETYFSKDYVDPYVYKRSLGLSDDLEIDKEITDRSEKIRDLEKKGLKYSDLLEDSNTDWQQTCQELFEQVDDLTVTLKNTAKNLKASEEQVKKLEESILQTDGEKTVIKEEQSKDLYSEFVDKGRDVDVKHKTEFSAAIRVKREEARSTQEDIVDSEAKQENQKQTDEVLAAVKVKEEYEDMGENDSVEILADNESDNITTIDVTESFVEKLMAEDDSERTVEKQDVKIKYEKDIVKEEDFFIKEEVDRKAEDILDQVKDVTEMVVEEKTDVKGEEIQSLKGEDVQEEFGKEVVQEEDVVVQDTPKSTKVQEQVLGEVEGRTETTKAEILDEGPKDTLLTEEILGDDVLTEDAITAKDAVTAEDTTLLQDPLPPEDGGITTEDAITAQDTTIVEDTIPEEDILSPEDVIKEEDAMLVEDTLPPENAIIAKDAITAKDTTLLEDPLPPEDGGITIEDAITAQDTTIVEDTILEEDILPPEDVIKEEDAMLVEDTFPPENAIIAKDATTVEDTILEGDKFPPEDATQIEDAQLEEDTMLLEDVVPTEAMREDSGFAAQEEEQMQVFGRTAGDTIEAQAITSEPFEVPFTDGIPERTPSGLEFEKTGERLKARPSADSLTTQTLQSKCRVKDHLIKSMADQLRDLAKSNVWSGSRLLENMSEDPVKTYDFNRTTLFKYLKGEEPQNFADSMQPNDSYNTANPLNVQIWRKLDKDSLLIEWGPPPSPEVVGFQIFINGEFMYWVHSAKRNKALLHPLDLTVELDITVSPVDAEGNIVFRSSLKYTP